MEGVGAEGASAASPVAQWGHDVWRMYQYYLDKTTPHTVYRWIGTLVVAAIYCLRLYYIQGFYIVAYGLGIYILNLLIGFLSPLVDPEVDPSDGPMLPTKGSDEFKPFIRRLPEFKFWAAFGYRIIKQTKHMSIINNTRQEMDSPAGENGGDKEEGIKEIIFNTSMHANNPVVSATISRYSFTKAFVIAFVMTFFSMFDVPVFWPILLCYWIVLFVLTMRRQIAHMIKYKYIPFSIGKQKYGGKKSSASSTGSCGD